MQQVERQNSESKVELALGPEISTIVGDADVLYELLRHVGYAYPEACKEELCRPCCKPW